MGQQNSALCADDIDLETCCRNDVNDNPLWGRNMDGELCVRMFVCMYVCM